MLILIPPSEGKAKIKSSDTLFKDTNFKYEREVNQVVRHLSILENEDLRSIYGTSQEKSEIFHRQNQDIFNSHCAMAIERYTGVVYEYIDWNSLNNTAKKYMEKYTRYKLQRKVSKNDMARSYGQLWHRQTRHKIWNVTKKFRRDTWQYWF